MSLPGIRHVTQWYRANTSQPALLVQVLIAQTEQTRLALLAQPGRTDPKHLGRYDGQVFSQTGIDGIVAEVFARIGTTDRTFIEVGTEGGLETNTTFLLWLGWTGCWVEGNGAHVASALRTFAGPVAAGRLRVREALVTAENVNEVLDAAGAVNEADLFSLDIDRNTFWVLKAVRRRPRVVVVEYNSVIPPSVEWAVKYDPAKWWDGSDYYGASLKSFERWGREAGYRLVGCDLAGYNAVFVRDDLAGDRFPDPATAEHLYEARRGYMTYRSGPPPRFSE